MILFYRLNSTKTIYNKPGGVELLYCIFMVLLIDNWCYWLLINWY